MYKFVSLQVADDGIHKYKVVLLNETTKRKVSVKFGAVGYEDFTHKGDKIRKGLYLVRHASRENWGASGVASAGFWSRWLLWGNSTSLQENLKYVKERFKL
jgi:hypothetical protein|tara:strand:+ start:99 stop:401 length:303 start_codon:yes stop_codon:yes gene_type:complete